MASASDSYQRYGLLAVAGLLFVCILAQMPGESFELLSEVTIADTFMESESEDPSVLPPVPELRPSGVLRLGIVRPSTPNLPVLATSVFHPPLT